MVATMQELTTNLTNLTNKEEGKSPNQPLDARLRRASKIDEQAELQASGVEVVQELRPMLGREISYGLQLHDDGAKADEVCLIELAKGLPLVRKGKGLSGDKRNLAGGELNRQAFLIHGFKEAGAHVPIDLEYRSLDLKDFVRVEHLFVRFVRFVVHSCDGDAFSDRGQADRHFAIRPHLS